MNFIPNIPPKLFSFSAVIVGYLLIDNSTANEQNALGNWLMLTAQTLCTNAYYLQVQNERKGINSTNNNVRENDYTDEHTVEMLEKIVNALNIEIQNIKKSM